LSNIVHQIRCRSRLSREECGYLGFEICAYAVVKFTSPSGDY